METQAHHQFLKGVQTPIAGLIEEVQGMSSYLPWATAVSLAGRPPIKALTWGGRPALALLGGAVVAVESGGQTTWLPVLDARNKPVGQPTVRDISDSINRARAKAVATCYGVGLCLYAGERDPAAFLKKLGVKPGDDLTQVPPAISTKPGSAGAPYVDWATALAAAKIAAPDFRWDVVLHEVPNPETGEINVLPVLPTDGGYMVAVEVAYRGVDHVEWLPIMGVVEVETPRGPRKMDHQPLKRPTVFDWNKAVMRCLTKAIAVVSGYGLSVYCGEDIASLRRDPAAQGEATGAEGEAREGQKATKPVVAPPQAEAQAEDQVAKTVDDQIVRLGSITDAARILRAVEMAPGLFGSHADRFIAACNARLEDLKASTL